MRINMEHEEEEAHIHMDIIQMEVVVDMAYQWWWNRDMLWNAIM